MLGHRPKCAQHAAERYAEFPKLRQVDSLRPYLIKYDLFPPRRDPETAPIRMEELKELVRKWNLHQERNFWRHNTTKDDIVRVLYNYKTKLEQCQGDAHHKKRRSSTLGPRKNNKSRNWLYSEVSDEDHRSQIMEAIKDHPIIKSVLSFNMSPPDPVMASWKRRDFFQNNWAFISLCRSVAPDGHGYLRPNMIESDMRLKGKVLKEAAAAALPLHDGEDESFTSSLEGTSIVKKQSSGVGQGLSSGSALDPNAKVKLTCSVALLNISLRPDAEAIFLEQNGMQDLLNLMASTTDADVLLNCSAAIVNITRNSEGLFNLMQSDVVPNLVRAARFDNEYLKQTAALALCQLTSHDGGEVWLIQEGAVQGLNNLLHCHNSYTKLLAVRGLVNLLTFVSAPRAETITSSIMKIMYTMSTIPDVEVQSLCAEALEVLSSFSGVRHLITEAGGVSILSFLMHSGHLAEHAMATCALAIANMSQVKKSRKDMVSMGICSVLISILRIGDRQTKVTCAQALWQLSREQELREILINDKVLPMLTDLLLLDDAELSTLAALNLANFCADPLCRPMVMREGAGKALVGVLKKGGLDVQKVVLQAMVHLVSSGSAFDSLMGYGLVEAMHALVQSHAHDTALAVTYFSMSTFESARERLGSKGVVPSLLTLFSADDVTVKTLCLAALQNISSAEDKTLPCFKGMGMVQALSCTLQVKGLEGRAYQYCAAILLNMSNNEGLCKDMYEDGAVLFLVQLAKVGNEATKYYCSAALYNLSLRHVLTREPGFMSGLVDLTSNHASARQLLCSKIFANASMNSKGRTAIGSSSAVLVCLCRMLRSTCEDCDKIQYYAALAVCNSLSIYFKRADIEEMVRLNIVNDLAVIMMLRVNEVATKTILAKALFNLLVREDTRELVDKQDVTQSLLRLMKLQVPELSQICILAVANLSRELDRFGAKLGKIRAVGILLAEGTNRLIGPEVKTLCSHALANLSFEGSCRRAMVREELVMGMRSITATVDGRALEDSAVLFYNLAQDASCHDGLIDKKAIRLIVHTAHATTLAVVQELCIAALCTLSTNPASHVQLVHDAMGFIAHALHANSTPRVARLDAARLLANLVALHEPARKAAVDAKCIAALADLTKMLQEEEDIAMVGKILRDISNSDDALPGMLQDGVMNIIFKLSKMDPGSIKLDAAHTLANLSFCKLRATMVESGLVETMTWLTLEDCLQYNTPIFQRVSVAMRNVMLVPEGVRSKTIMEDKLLDVIFKVSQYPEDAVQLNAAVTLYHVASHKRTQHLVVKKGVLPALIDLADLGHPQIRQICSAALHTLPPEATDKCSDKRLIKILMTMLHADADKLAMVEALAERPRSKTEKDWEPTGGRYKYTRKEVKPSWQNHLLDTDLASRPFQPVRVVLEPPQATGEGLVNSLHTVKSAVGEYHKLPLKLEKLTPAELASGLRGAHLFPQKRPPQPGSKGSLDGLSEASSDGSIGFGPVTIGLDSPPPHPERTQREEGGSTLAALFPSISAPPSPDRVPGSARLARPPKGPSVGHGIIAARDRQQHDEFVAQMGLPQVLKPAVQHAAVASAFANKNNTLQRPAVTVIKARSGGSPSPPRLPTAPQTPAKTPQPRTPGTTNNPSNKDARG